MEFFPVRVGRLWHRLPREAVAGSVQGQTWSALVPGRFLLEAEGWNRMGFKVSSNPNQEICSALITVNYFFPSSGKGFADEAFVSYKAFAVSVVAVLLHCWLCVTLDVQAACRDTTVTQELLKEGFHRDLLVKVELGEDAGGCAVAAQMRLPPGIYVDPYELATLQQHNLTKAVLFPDVIDVEAPEYLAEALVLLLFLEPEARCSRCFGAAVPVHARYHRPARGTRQALVALQSPELLLCCCHRHLSAECWEPAEVDTPCSSDTSSPCQWHTTKHRPAYEESMLKVPVGLREHSSLVCALTLLTTGLCSGFILAAACKYGHFSQ